MKSERKKSGADCCGFTLIEVMLSCFILAIVSIGAMHYSVRPAVMISTQGNYRAALLRAEQRMELIKAVPVTAPFWSALAVGGSRYLSNYDAGTGLFTATSAKPDETVSVNTTEREIWSKVTRINTQRPGSTAQANCVQIEVSVSYGSATNERVFLESYSPVYN